MTTTVFECPDCGRISADEAEAHESSHQLEDWQNDHPEQDDLNEEER